MYYLPCSRYKLVGKDVVPVDVNEYYRLSNFALTQIIAVLYFTVTVYSNEHNSYPLNECKTTTSQQLSCTSSDFLKFVGPSGQKITRTGLYCQVCQSRVSDKILCLCIFFCIGNATGMPERSRSTRN